MTGVLIPPGVTFLALPTMTEVYFLNSRKSKSPAFLRFLCHLLTSTTRFNFSFSSQYVPRVYSCIAEALFPFISDSSAGWHLRLSRFQNSFHNSSWKN